MVEMFSRELQLIAFPFQKSLLGALSQLNVDQIFSKLSLRRFLFLWIADDKRPGESPSVEKYYWCHLAHLLIVFSTDFVHRRILITLLPLIHPFFDDLVFLPSCMHARLLPTLRCQIP